jgi:hypothetical protein
VLVAVLLVSAAPQARAEIQKSGSQVFPGIILIGVHPLGINLDLRSGDAAYKLAFDFSVRVLDAKVGLYVGGGLGYAVAARPRFTSHDAQPWVFVLLTFEKLVSIPLVPYLQVGVGTDLFWQDGDFVLGTFALRIGAGFDYWLTKNVGVGAETHFTFGPTWSNTNPVIASFYGQWDMLFGARFAF